MSDQEWNQQEYTAPLIYNDTKSWYYQSTEILEFFRAVYLFLLLKQSWHVIIGNKSLIWLGSLTHPCCSINDASSRFGRLTLRMMKTNNVTPTSWYPFVSICFELKPLYVSIVYLVFPSHTVWCRSCYNTCAFTPRLVSKSFGLGDYW